MRGIHGAKTCRRFPRIRGEKADEESADRRVVRQGSEVILVVEDETPVRNLTRRILDSAGYEVITATNGLEALQVVQDRGGAVDLVLTDVVMPRMGGQEFAQRLAQRWPRLRVVFMSGYPDDAIANHGVRAAAVQFIARPFVPSDLLARIRSVFDGE